MKKVVVALIAVAVLGGAGYYWKSRRDGAKAAEVKPATAAVERGELRVTVSSTGKVVSNLDVEIKCKGSGNAIRVPFDVSEAVKKGELVVELDPVDELRIVKQVTVSLSASRAKLVIAGQNQLIAERTLVTDKLRGEAALQAADAHAKDARAKANRVKELVDKKLASQEESETAETAAVQAEVGLSLAHVKLEELKTQEQALELTRQQVQLAQAQVDSDTIALELAQQRLADTKVVSPIDGVVSARTVQEGQIVSSGISNVGGGTAAMTLSDLSRIFVLGAVDESDIGKVKKDQAVTITADAFPGKRFTGKVVRIAAKGVNVSNVVTFEVKIEVLSDEKNLLKPEMTANVEVLVAEKKDVTLAPADSLLRKAGKMCVTVVNGGANEERTVETGISDGLKTEIVSGLKEGETVLVHKGETTSRWGGMPPAMMRMMGGGGRPR